MLPVTWSTWVPSAWVPTGNESLLRILRAWHCGEQAGPRNLSLLQTFQWSLKQKFDRTAGKPCLRPRILLPLSELSGLREESFMKQSPHDSVICVDLHLIPLWLWTWGKATKGADFKDLKTNGKPMPSSLSPEASVPAVGYHRGRPHSWGPASSSHLQPVSVLNNKSNKSLANSLLKSGLPYFSDFVHLEFHLKS